MRSSPLQQIGFSGCDIDDNNHHVHRIFGGLFGTYHIRLCDLGRGTAKRASQDGAWRVGLAPYSRRCIDYSRSGRSCRCSRLYDRHIFQGMFFFTSALRRYFSHFTCYHFAFENIIFLPPSFVLICSRMLWNYYSLSINGDNIMRIPFIISSFYPPLFIPLLLS